MLTPITSAHLSFTGVFILETTAPCCGRSAVFTPDVVESPTLAEALLVEADDSVSFGAAEAAIELAVLVLGCSPFTGLVKNFSQVSENT